MATITKCTCHTGSRKSEQSVELVYVTTGMGIRGSRVIGTWQPTRPDRSGYSDTHLWCVLFDKCALMLNPTPKCPYCGGDSWRSGKNFMCKQCGRHCAHKNPACECGSLVVERLRNGLYYCFTCHKKWGEPNHNNPRCLKCGGVSTPVSRRKWWWWQCTDCRHMFKKEMVSSDPIQSDTTV